MTAKALRQRYIAFFSLHQHHEISGKSLIPENDPSVLFTTAGMHPLVPYLLGQSHPAGARLVNVQKCLRTGDIELVGDTSHLTFFEMLGNWSLRDYFKQEALSWSYDFLINPAYLGLDKNQISVTVFAGDKDAPFDQESYDIWLSLGIPSDRIYALGKSDNWWGPVGSIGPCGPDSEMFYDTQQKPCGPRCRPGCSCGKYFEIWNNVFIQYNKESNGQFIPLKKPCVDTGMGVERVTTILQGKNSVYETELFADIILAIENLSGKSYGADKEESPSFRIIADHMKTATMILGDDFAVKPSNVGQGYILRRLIRRAIRHGLKIGIEENFLYPIVEATVKLYKETYHELEDRKESILSEVEREEKQFRETLQHGQKEFEKILPNLQRNPSLTIPGRVAFRLYDTYGFPLEMTEELAKEQGLQVDHQGFKEALRKHQISSQKSAEKIFKGGLADDSLMATRYHTATHLLHEALRQILGAHVMQKGSNITSERLRFDFVHTEALSSEQKKNVENLVNAKIAEKLLITVKTMSLEEAQKLKARALFQGKYGEKIKVYFIGDFSIEVCGGPHVENTGDLGHFQIIKEQSISRGVRRIRAVIT